MIYAAIYLAVLFAFCCFWSGLCDLNSQAPNDKGFAMKASVEPEGENLDDRN